MNTTPKPKHSVGDVVVYAYKHGNAGATVPSVGVIESIGKHHNATNEYPYKVSGFVGCCAEDEIQKITHYDALQIWKKHEQHVG
jgi:hypothetical protein